MIKELEIYNRVFKVGDIVRHFKAVNNQAETDTDYHYVIMAFPEHTETGELFVAYRQLYGNNDVYIRPAKMFFSEVDREKYPNVKQRYRMEKITSVEDLAYFLSDTQLQLKKNLFEQLSKSGSEKDTHVILNEDEPICSGLTCK